MSLMMKLAQNGRMDKVEKTKQTESKIIPMAGKLDVFLM
jgi:hypothetical protein